MADVGISFHKDVFVAAASDDEFTKSKIEMPGPAVAVPSRVTVTLATTVAIPGSATFADVHNEGSETVDVYPVGASDTYIASGAGYVIQAGAYRLVPFPTTGVTHLSIRVKGTEGNDS